MRTETETIAYALAADPRILPWIPELLADLDELGGDPALVVVAILAAAFLRFAEDQQREYDYMLANVVPAVWVLQRGGAAARNGEP